MSAPSDLVRALTPVADALESLGVAYYVGGSMASSARGIARASLDVDLVADLGDAHRAPLLARLRPAYYVSEEAIEEAVRERSSFNVIHLETMLKVDIFVAKGRPFDRDALARARLERLEEEATRTFPVASEEDVVLSKLAWYRLGGERSERQWTDVLGVIRMAGPSLDTTYLDRHAESLGVGDLLKRARFEAGAGDDVVTPEGRGDTRKR